MSSPRPRFFGIRGSLALLIGLPFALGLVGRTPPLSAQAPSETTTLTLEGLLQPVEILRDRWGINHIYARTQSDLFFAQGYAAARDRLFQFEVWRRQATGTVAEILGPRELLRDQGTRLFKFRGDMQQEMAHYHPDGVEIITSYVKGVNAYIAETERHPDLLPMEFALLGIRPQAWTPEVVISRHQGLLGNIGQELSTGRAVHAVGASKVLEISTFHPGEPNLTMDAEVDGSLLSDEILRLYDAFRGPIEFRPEDIGDVSARNRAGDDAPESFARLATTRREALETLRTEDRNDIGSNNWVVSGDLTLGGSAIMANDPHRTQAVPSLRYWVHLVGPGWNVIGGGEPEIPGVSIGHNQYGAWGLTVFSTDGEDLYVYETDPSDPERYRYQGRWEPMRVIVDTIPVKGAAPEIVELKYTRHGPVVFEDPEHRVAYAVRAAWSEVGGAPYLASLRMDQARTWDEFVEACTYSNIPGENMVWAGVDGTIGWQSVGIAPIRRGWSGLVPVPGDGRYEWDGYLPIAAKPHVVNPPAGYFGTANSNLTSADYPYRDIAVGWSWADPFRWGRVNEVLGSGRKHTMQDMVRLQTDYLSIPARTLVPMLAHVTSADRTTERARGMLLGWDYRLDPTSVEAGIYVAWERRLQAAVSDLMIPAEARPHIRSVSLTRVIQWLGAPDGAFGQDPIAGRDALLLSTLEAAVGDMRQRLGNDMARWQYGQESYKHVLIRHPLSSALNAELRARLDAGPAPRGGNSYTVGATGSGDNQTSGASFRIIVDTGNWDSTLGANTPGQSGDPDSPFYRNLFDLWANDRFFPAFYSREKIEGVAVGRMVLQPGR